MYSSFDEQIDRRPTAASKWQAREGELPMSIADMDFPTAPEVVEAIQRRAAHGIFGYTEVPEDWYAAYQSWWSRRHDWNIEQKWLLFSTGVVPAISSVVRKITTVGENVLVLTPVYNIFFNSIVNNGRNPLKCPLRYENGVYSIDFAELERKLSNPQTSLLLFCNPHNPVGKIWDKTTLEKIGNLCAKYHVVVLSDEIHCDLTAPGKSYIPFASVSPVCEQNSITCVAPTKAFNLAGLQTAAVVVPNPVLRHKVWRGLNTDEVAEPNVFAAMAPQAAFGCGEAWLDALREYLWENRQVAERFLMAHIPGIAAVKAEATYLLWLDCRSVADDGDQLCDSIRENSGLVLSSGNAYHAQGAFLRMNLACPRSVLLDGLNRLQRSIGITDQEDISRKKYL